MHTLLTEDGKLVETQDEILKETTNFYKRLYKSEKTDILAQDFLLNNIKKTLTDDDRDSIEGEITLDEIFNAIKSLANENSPGCDGLTVEFYQTFISVIGNDLVDVINDQFHRGGVEHNHAPWCNRFNLEGEWQKTFEKLSTDILNKLWL